MLYYWACAYYSVYLTYGKKAFGYWELEDGAVIEGGIGTPKSA